jgi:rhodanese-related sulfurtransferase
MMQGCTRAWPWTAAVALAVLPILMGQGCPSTDVGPGQDVPDVVTEITPLDAHALIQNHLDDPNFIILDVRSAEEFAAGHLENAVSLCVLCSDPAFREAIADIDRSLTILVYCRTGRRSTTATTIMAEEGFTSLYNMTGGITQWQADGLPVVR